MKTLIIFLIMIVALCLTDCDDTITSDDINNLVMPDSNVSYAQHISPLFEVKCVTCHNSSRKEADLDLSSWVTATEDPSIIFPGSDSTSILVWAIEGYPPYPLMPPNERLKQNHINGIRIWIREGAKNN